MNLQQLIDDCKANDRKAQEQLYRLYAAKLFSVCLKYSRNYVEAQDNLQDGFLLVFEKIGQFKFNGSFDGWIKRVMVNNVLQKYRKTGFLELIHDNFESEQLVEVELEDQNISMDYLLQIIQELPDRYRLVFNLYVMDDHSHKDIAELLGITTGTSKSNLARARMILKDKIDQYNRLNNLPSAR